MNQLKLYENVVIGNFLYGLGSAIRGKSKTDIIVSSINLLQQTPVDTELADVFLELPGVVRLIEFKQLSNDSDKEPKRVKLLAIAIKNNKKYEEISKAIHWFVETNPQKQTFVSRIVPYLEAYSIDNSTHTLEEPTLAEFIDKIASEAVSEISQFSRDDLREYLDFVRTTLGNDKVGAGGLILVVNEKGLLHFTELADMSQLNLQLSKFISQTKEKFEFMSKASQVYEENLEKSIKMDKEIRRSRGLGL
jgi:DNA-binding ferritin-like protein (Dps family)